MPGLRAPCDYSKEPPRHPILLINSKEPFNAEPPRLSLISSYVTSVDFFYKRNHGPVPIVDDIESSYRVCIGGLVEKPIELSMADIKKLPKYNVTATLQCAGNRRTAMSKVRAVKGVGWDISAIGNAIWGGAKLADVLELVGIPKLTKTTPLGGKHVEFVSVDMCKEEKGGPYKASIPLIQSTNSEADVLLAYEMNGEVENFNALLLALRLAAWNSSIGFGWQIHGRNELDHGYPLHNVRVFSCKGTTRCFLLQLTGKILTGPLESLEWIFQSSAICSLEDDNTVQHGKVKVHGYAVSGGGRSIERLDVSFDGGKAWVEASRHQKSGIPYNAIADDDIYCDKWAWVLFEAEGDVLHNTEIVAKAVDTAANTIRVPIIEGQNIGFTGVFKLIFKPLVDEFPYFGAVCYSLMEKKNMDFTLKVVGGELSAILEISDAIEDMIQNAIEDSITWPIRKIIPILPGDYRVLSAICSLEDDNTVQHRKVKVHGYAVSGGGRSIERLNVSFDGGKAWVEASRHQKSGIP
ncbi:unnamed protein product [Camellia sinensis]